MKHGVEHTEVMEIFRKIRLDKMYKELQSNAEAIARLRELEDLFSERSENSRRRQISLA